MGSEDHIPAGRLAEAAAAAVVRIVSPRGEAVGFVVSQEGHVVTNLHAVAGASTLKVVFPDGREVESVGVALLDPRRDLALLRIEGTHLNSLEVELERTLTVGERVVVAGRNGPFGPQPIDTRISLVRELSPGLVLYELERPLDDGETGLPLLDGHGKVVALCTAARRDGDRVAIGIPAAYLRAGLQVTDSRPISLLSALARGRRRQVPEHPVSLLAQDAEKGLRNIAEGIGRAITAGAPAYNGGDIEKCARIYEETTERLLQGHGECPGARTALEAGMERTRQLQDPDDRAWALRDTFDGLLAAIERQLKQPASPGAPAGKKPYLN